MDDDEITQERSGASKQMHLKGKSEFESESIFNKYNEATTKAQDAFLARDLKAAKMYAITALKILPTSQLFSLCSAICEAQGHFDQAADFRLLQAFQANDKAVWKELLQEFLDKNLWYRASVCLKRLSMIAEPGSRERRDLLLQLADLYVALEEHARAIIIYRNLWNVSNCTDFETFATLSSLFFQLGKWRNLEKLVESSANAFLKSKYKMTSTGSSTSINAEDSAEAVDMMSTSENTKKGKKQLRRDGKPKEIATSPSVAATSLFDALFNRCGGISRASDTNDEEKRHTDSVAIKYDGATNDQDINDDFSFNASDLIQHTPLLSTFNMTEDTNDDDPWVELTEEKDIQSYLCLINVYAELLLEKGLFDECVKLITQAAAHLRMHVQDMIPDLFLKYTIATTYLGMDLSDVNKCVDKMIESANPRDYGDVLYDCAESLLSGGAFEAAEKLFKYLLSYYRSHERHEHPNDVTFEEENDCKQRDVALLFGIAKCAANTTSFSPYVSRSPVLPFSMSGNKISINTAVMQSQLHPAVAALLEIHTKLDPFHSPTRVMLSELFRVYWNDYGAAEAILKPVALTSEQHAALKRKLAISSQYLSEELLTQYQEFTRESGFQRTQCDMALVYLYANPPINRYLDALNVGIPLLQFLLTSVNEEDNENIDRMSIVTGTGQGTRRRSVSMFIPSMTRSSSAIVPVSRIAGSLAGDIAREGIIGSSFLGATKSIATSFRARQAQSSILLSKRGAAAGSSVITSSATTALSVRAASASGVGSRAQTKASTIASGIEAERAAAKDSTGIFQFHRKHESTMKALKAKEQERAEKVARCKTNSRSSRSAIAVKQTSDASKKEGWDVSSVGNLGDLELMEQQLVDEEEQGEWVSADKKQRGRCITFNEDENIEHQMEANVFAHDDEDEGLMEMPSIDLIIAKNFAADPQMAELFRMVTTGKAVETTTETEDEQGATNAIAPTGGAPQGIHISNTISAKRGPEGEQTAFPLTATATTQPVSFPEATFSEHDKRPTMKEFVFVYGRRTLVILAMTIIHCYDGLNEHLEAKEFAAYFIFRASKQIFRKREGLLVPLRVAMFRQTLLSGHTEDAVRTVTSLLQREGTASGIAYSMFDISDASTATTSNIGGPTAGRTEWGGGEEWIGGAGRGDHGRSSKTPLMSTDVVAITVRDMWESISTLVNNGMKSGILKRLITDRHRSDYELLCIEGNASYRTAAFKRALNLYHLALLQSPKDSLLLLQVALCYMHLSYNRKLAERRHELVKASMYYMNKYVNAVAMNNNVIKDSLFDSEHEGDTGTSHAGESNYYNGKGAFNYDTASLLSGAGTHYRSFLENSYFFPVGLNASTKVVEALYNVGRLYQYYCLNYLAVPFYRRVMEMAKMQLPLAVVPSTAPNGRGNSFGLVSFSPDVTIVEMAANLNRYNEREAMTVKAVMRAAQYNLAFIYGNHGGNENLKLETLPRLDE